MSSFPRASPSRKSLPVSITNSPPSLDTISSSRTRAVTITTSPTPLHHNDRLVSTTPPLSTTPTPPNDPTPTPRNDPISITPTLPNDRLLLSPTSPAPAYSSSPSPPPVALVPPAPSTTPPNSSPSSPTSSSPPSPSGFSPPPPGTSTSSPPPSSSKSTGLVVGIVIGGVVILVILSILFLWCKKKKRTDHRDYVPPPHGPKVSGGSGSNHSGGENSLPPLSPAMSLGFATSTFSYDELAMATDAFSEANLLGQGGFGYVYKGVLPNGKEVAVKQLKAGSGQGEREFQAEVEIISRVHHKHLVSLVGYCITGSQRMLVYEYVPNNTMEFHLHGKGRPTMDWSTRLRIALGSAKGLAYLHEDCHPKIIHRDIKAANILLDFHFEAMVADFGLAKLCSDVDTHISTRVMGTFGYLAPEYASSGKLTHKSDVFSFGVVLLELITGRRPVNSSQSYADDILVDCAALAHTSFGRWNFDTLVDPQLQRDYRPNEMACMVACAAACVRHSARCRPQMSQVVQAFEGDVSLSDLNEGIKPGHNTVYSSCGISDYDTSQYNEDMKKFRKMVLGTREDGSNENSALTNEYGLYPSSLSSGGQQTTREMEMGKMCGR
ncbi:unnamed protein product [Camellia sinensis]